MKNYKFHIITFGCQMNENDSIQLKKILLKRDNFIYEQNVSNADIVILNTCCVREKPEHKVFSEAGRIGRQGKIIGVIGCVAQEHGEKLLEKSQYIDFVVGTHNIDRIPDTIEDFIKNRKKISITSFYDKINSINIFTEPYDNYGFKAYVTIMQGCENFCTYCIVPFVRGKEYSRKSEDICREVEYLAEKGVKEITLLGQNVNSYGKKDKNELSFPELLYKLHEINGIERIRFTTSHPKDFSNELIDAIADLRKVCKQIHLPLQSGSDKILKLMNRKYTKKEYLDKIERLKSKIPEIQFTTDIIVGFPFEEDYDFFETLEVIKKVRYISSFSFKYSPRPFSKYSDVDNVDEQIKKKRLKILQDIQKKITLEFNKSSEGKIFTILADGISKKNSNELTGRSEDNRTVNFQGDRSLIGSFLKVKILKAYQNSLKGEIVDN